MVIVKLQGGLGNQLFQYAAGRGLAGSRDSVYLDHEFLERNAEDSEHFTARRYELSIFPNLKAQRASGWQLKLFRDPRRFYSVWRRLLQSIIEDVRQLDQSLVSFSARGGYKIWYLEGYFQSEKYFIGLRAALLQELQFPEQEGLNKEWQQKIAASVNTVSIHIRRGDYLRSKVVENIHGVLPKTYYEKCIALLRERHRDLTLLIFSDDIGWAKKNLHTGGLTTYYMDHNTGSDSWRDMALMRNCKHHIIANSSFSWWGAWLSEQDGMVFSPAYWFNPEVVKFNIKDIIPASWVVVDYD